MASPTTSTETLKFRTNVPEVISLAFDEGREVTSPYNGDQIMFSLDDGRRMYLPPFIGQRIRDLGIRAHEAFEIEKSEVTRGNRRTVEYQVRTLPATRKEPTHHARPAAPMLTNHPQSNTPDYSEQLKESIARAQAARGASAATPAATPSVAEQLGEILADCGKAAYDAAGQIEGHAEETSEGFRFGQDAIERFTVTLFIEFCKRSSR